MKPFGRIITLTIMLLMVSLSCAFAQENSWDALNRQAVKYARAGKFADAVDFGKQALAAAEAEFGGQSQQYMLALENLAYYHDNLDEHDPAEDYYLRSLALSRELFGIKHEDYAYSLKLVGNFYLSWEQFALADSFYSAYMDVLDYTSGKKSNTYAVTLNDIGVAFHKLGAYAFALKYYNLALPAYQQSEGPTGENYLICCGNIAYLYDLWNLPDSAIKWYAHTVKLYEIAGKTRTESYTTNLVVAARMYQAAGRYEESEQLFLRLIDAQIDLYGENSAFHLAALNNLGLLYSDMGRYAEAESLYVRAIKGAQANMNSLNSQNYPIYVGNLTEILKIENKYAEAEFWIRELMALKSKEGETDSVYVAYEDQLGNLFREQGLFYEAEKQYLELLDKKAELYGKESPQYYLTLNNLGVLYLDAGRFSEAAAALEKALAGDLKTHGRKSEHYAKTLQNYALLQKKAGNFTAAEAAYTEAKQIYEDLTLENTVAYAIMLDNFGNLLDQLGRFEDAEQTFLLSEKTFAAIPNGDIMDRYKVTNNLAAHYYLTNDYEASAQYFQSAEAILKDAGQENTYLHAILMDNYAGMLRESGKLKESESYYLKANKIIKEELGSNNYEFAVSVNNLGLFFEEKGDAGKAEDYYRMALELYLQTFSEKHPEYTITLANMARLQLNAGNLKVAGDYFDKTLSNYLFQIREFFPALSEKEKRQFWQSVNFNFEIFNSYVLKAHDKDPDAVLALAEMLLHTKGLLYHSTRKVREEILSGDDQSLKADFQRWISLKEQLAYAYTLPAAELQRVKLNVDSLENEANALEKQLSRQSAAFDQHFDADYNWRDVRKNLASDEAIVEFVRFNLYEQNWTDSVIYFAVITTPDNKKSPQLVILPNGNDLEGKYLTNYRRSISNGMDDPYSYKIFWQPLEPYLNKYSTISIIPDGVYNLVNPETFQTPDGQNLLEKYSIRYLTNSSEVIDGGMEAFDQKDAVLFGNPDFGKPDGEGAERGMEIVSLPGTEVEIGAVADLLKQGGWNTQVNMGTDADEGALKNLQQPALLHLATHGYFFRNEDLPDAGSFAGIRKAFAAANPLLRSGLLLEGAANAFSGTYVPEDEEDGILTAYEIMNLDLSDTRLVTLSACETGLGEIMNGEGVYGLQRAFRIAGADYVIMSLWKVSDSATAALMQVFYENLANGMPVAEAFRLAKIRMKMTDPNPYHWGAFILTGN